MSLVYLSRGLTRPGSPAVTDTSGAWSYEELARQASFVAANLKQAGCRQAEPVGLFLDPSRESLAAFLGVMAAGAIAVPISVQATPREVAYVVSDAGLSRVLGDAAFASKLDQTGLRLTDRTRLFHAASPPEGSPGAGEPALILYTSGTTSQPKGVLHSHAGLMNQLQVLHQAWSWSDEDSLLHVLPLHHIHGLVNGALGALWAGAQLRLEPRFDPANVWSRFVAGQATVFYAVPTIYYQLLETWESQPEAMRAVWAKGASSLRLMVSGSAALTAAIWQRWRDVTGQGLLERYGMTEIGMALSNPYSGERRAGSVGQPLGSMEIRLVNEQGEDVANGEPGEIWVRGPSLFQEYWRRPVATLEAFQDGYFRTGDVAQVEDGYFRILGRASIDIIKSAGYKLSALEIEAVLAEHPSVREVAVLGLPSEEWGEIVAACVVLKPGASMSEEEMKAWCLEKLSPYKMPRLLRLFESLPRNSMGKVTKAELRSPTGGRQFCILESPDELHDI